MQVSIQSGPHQSAKMTNAEVADFLTKHPDEVGELVIMFNQGASTIASTPHLPSGGHIAIFGKYLLFAKKDHVFAVMHVGGKDVFKPFFSGMSPADRKIAADALNALIAEQKAAFAVQQPTPALTADMVARIIAEQLQARDAAAAAENARKAEEERKAGVVRKAEEEYQAKLKALEEKSAKLAEVEAALKKKVNTEIARIESPQVEEQQLAVYTRHNNQSAFDFNIVVMSVAAVVIAVLFVLAMRAPTAPQENPLAVLMLHQQIQAQERHEAEKQRAAEKRADELRAAESKADELAQIRADKRREAKERRDAQVVNIPETSSWSDFVSTVVYSMLVVFILYVIMRMCIAVLTKRARKLRRLGNN